MDMASSAVQFDSNVLNQVPVLLKYLVAIQATSIDPALSKIGESCITYLEVHRACVVHHCEAIGHPLAVITN